MAKSTAAGKKIKKCAWSIMISTETLR